LTRHEAGSSRVGAAALQDDLHGLLRPRKAERLWEGPRRALHFRRRLPLRIDGGEAAREEDAVRLRVDDLEKVRSEIQVVDETRPASGPLPVVHRAVEGDDLAPGPARVEEVDAHRPLAEVRVDGGGAGIGGNDGKRKGREEGGGRAFRGHGRIIEP